MLLKKFFKYVIPSMVSMWIFALYTIVDGLFVAWGVGEQALAAVNISMPYVILIYSIGLVFATGASILVNRTLGKGEGKLANELFSQNIWIVIVISAAVTGISLIFIDPLVALLGATPSNTLYVKQYVSSIACFAGFFIVSYNLEAFVKADGTPIVAAFGVGSSAITNIVLDYVFVMKFHWGVPGAAVATGLAQVSSTILFFTYFIKFKKTLKFTKFKLRLRVYKQIIMTGLADGFTELSGGIVIYLFNQVILRVIGEAGIISYTVVSYMHTLVLNTMAGVSQGIQPLISYFYGAGKKAEGKQIFKYAIRLVLIVSAAVTAVTTWIPEIYVRLFLGGAQTQLFMDTANALRLYGFSFLLVGPNLVLSGYFAATAKPGYSFAIAILRGLVLLGASLFTMTVLLGEVGIWLSTGVSEFLCLVIAVGFYIINEKRLEILNKRHILADERLK